MRMDDNMMKAVCVVCLCEHNITVYDLEKIKEKNKNNQRPMYKYTCVCCGSINTILYSHIPSKMKGKLDLLDL